MRAIAQVIKEEGAYDYYFAWQATTSGWDTVKTGSLHNFDFLGCRHCGVRAQQVLTGATAPHRPDPAHRQKAPRLGCKVGWRTFA